MLRAYLAGPDVFFPAAAAHARRKAAICARFGIEGVAPLDDAIPGLDRLPPEAAWRAIFVAGVSMMESCDVVIANLTPFRGASADAGTLVEIGWFLGRGRPVFGYSNTAEPYPDRVAALTALFPDPAPDLVVERFGLPDNLMVAGAALYGGRLPVVVPPDGARLDYVALDTFQQCVGLVAAQHGLSA